MKVRTEDAREMRSGDAGKGEESIVMHIGTRFQQEAVTSTQQESNGSMNLIQGRPIDARSVGES